jgi:hypothetical protein
MTETSRATASAVPPIVLQKSFCGMGLKVSGLWARRLNKDVGDPRRHAPNSPGLSVARFAKWEGCIADAILRIPDQQAGSLQRPLL